MSASGSDLTEVLGASVGARSWEGESSPRDTVLCIAGPGRGKSLVGWEEGDVEIEVEEGQDTANEENDACYVVGKNRCSWGRLQGWVASRISLRYLRKAFSNPSKVCKQSAF